VGGETGLGMILITISKSFKRKADELSQELKLPKFSLFCPTPLDWEGVLTPVANAVPPKPFSGSSFGGRI
jgi:hypothetical protein